MRLVTNGLGESASALIVRGFLGAGGPPPPVTDIFPDPRRAVARIDASEPDPRRASARTLTTRPAPMRATAVRKG